MDKQPAVSFQPGIQQPEKFPVSFRLTIFQCYFMLTVKQCVVSEILIKVGNLFYEKSTFRDYFKVRYRTQSE